PVAPPDIRLEKRLPKDPEGQPADEPRRFGLRNELERRHEAALGMPPAHESLDPGQTAARHLDHRLVMKDELVFADRALQLEALHSCPFQSVPLVGISKPRCRYVRSVATRPRGVRLR